MRLNLEQLEQRDCAAVFHFNYQSPFYTERAQQVLEAGGRYLGNQIKDADIYVDAYARPLTNALAQAGPHYNPGVYSGHITFDPTYNWSYSYSNTELGYSYFTVAVHELEHILGIGTTLGWEAGSVSRGVAISQDKSHFASGVKAVASETVASYGLFGITDIDLNALNDIGWEVKYQAPLDYYFLSVALPNQPVQLYIVYQGYPVLLFTTGTFHVIVQDFNYDGAFDFKFISTAGYEVTYSSDGSLMDNLSFTYNLSPFYKYELKL